MYGPPKRITCPKCFALLRQVARWQGYRPISVGYLCQSTGCGFRAVGGAWTVGLA